MAWEYFLLVWLHFTERDINEIVCKYKTLFLRLKLILLYSRINKRVHLRNIVKSPHEYEEVPQHDMEWTLLMSEGILGAIHAMDRSMQGSP